MSGHHPFDELTEDLTPQRKRRIAHIKSELIAQLELQELRRVLAPSQAFGRIIAGRC